MMVVRVNLRAALGALCVLALLLMLYWAHCPDFAPRPSGGLSSGPDTDIECVINGEYSVGCRRDAARDEVFVPFSLVHKYFEIYGKVTNTDGVEKFEWAHSYGKIYHPKKRYDPRGTFTTFENYNVEVRDRVKCISGIEGVPVSTQWEPKGFFYPTQIAQFGLAHYSKHLTEPESRRRVLDDGEKHLDNWIVSQDAYMAREFDKPTQSNVIRFSTSEQVSSQVWLKLNVSQDFVLCVDLQLKANSSLVVVLQHKDRRKETVYLHYVTNTQMIYVQEEHIYHGIGTEGGWRRITRDLIIDMQKGWALQDRPKRRSPRNKFKVFLFSGLFYLACRTPALRPSGKGWFGSPSYKYGVPEHFAENGDSVYCGLFLEYMNVDVGFQQISSIILTGSGSLDNVTVSSAEHMEAFGAAARWLVRAQRARGGWPIPVRRRIAAGVAELEPGWHSAMSQGHAMSVLSRAYHRWGEGAYLAAARRALHLLDVPTHAGGVKALWMDKYVWYEEYPTTPPLFVLNGFIYTLLGLYDLHVIEGDNSLSLAKKMFDDGMTSLKTLLPLFDTGSGSFYDLRHFTLGVSPNIARWDYHATHVNQLYLLAGLDPDPLLAATARRWEAYMHGKRAAHN